MAKGAIKEAGTFTTMFQTLDNYHVGHNTPQESKPIYAQTTTIRKNRSEQVLNQGDTRATSSNSASSNSSWEARNYERLAIGGTW